jgi:putative ABC transport system permease protein
LAALWLRSHGISIPQDWPSPAAALTRVMKSLLFGISTMEVMTFAAVPLMLIVTAMVACYVPARRATLVDPVVALRDE